MHQAIKRHLIKNHNLWDILKYSSRLRTQDVTAPCMQPSIYNAHCAAAYWHNMYCFSFPDDILNAKSSSDIPQ